MKLLEIFATPQTKSITPKAVDRNEILPIRASFTKATRAGKVDMLGGGAFANVYQHKNRPGTVFKVGVVGAGNDDGYVLFLNNVFHKQRMQSNPYLPRVYDIKTYKVRENRTEYVIELERLEELQSVDAEDIVAMGQRLFKNYEELRDAFRKELPQTYAAEVEERDLFAGLIGRVMKKQLSMSHVQDKKFREACAIVGNIAKQTGHFVDMHSANVMIRRTSVGPQLVITDPLV